MKVMMIGAYPLEPDVVNGGIESVTSTLVPALAENDDIERITVVRYHYGDATTDYRRIGPKAEVYYVRGQSCFRMLTRSFLDVRKARKLAAHTKPDVVHGQEIGCFGDVATRCGHRSVVTIHGLPHVESRMSARSLRERLRSGSMERMIRRVLRRAAVVISISEYDAGQVGQLIRGGKTSIANPTAPEFFALAPSLPTEPRLLFAGVMTPRKNVLGLVNAFAITHRRVPDARLVIAGPQPDPCYADTVRDRLSALGLRHCVDFVGLVDNCRLRSEIAAARAVVLFSHEETAPTLIAQAMAAGKPVIASRVGGVPEMVCHGETGLLVDAGDEGALAARMSALLSNQAWCLQMGQRGHEIALNRFSVDAVARRTVAAYRAAASHHPEVVSEEQEERMWSR
ncbi:hypothetical protein BST22_14290 [Mycolicibacterium chubuense]|nr:hypothetical protein BST22_14290 [Mycolicibacterium chubuense]